MSKIAAIDEIADGLSREQAAALSSPRMHIDDVMASLLTPVPDWRPHLLERAARTNATGHSEQYLRPTSLGAAVLRNLAAREVVR